MNRRLVIIILSCVVIGVILIMATGARRILFPDKAERLFNQAKETFENKAFDMAIKDYQNIIEKYPKSKWVGKSFIGLAESFKTQGRLLEAKDAYKNALTKVSSSKLVKNIKKNLEKLNMEILFSSIITKDSIAYGVQPGDTLIAIARRFNTTVNLIKRSNGLKTSLIKPGTDLKISKAKFSVIVDKSQNTLSLKVGEEVYKIYPVSTGEGSSTPIGIFCATDKLRNPVWFTTGAIVPPDSPENILGTRWIGISKQGYGIHGTTEPQTIGTHVTKGCVRMHNRDVEELFDILPAGAEVVIVD